MASVSIVKLKVRRGTDVERRQIVLDSGELGYTLDEKRLFVGDGFTIGGNSVATRVVVADISSAVTYQNACIGDIICDYNTSLMYTVCAIDTETTPYPYIYSFALLGPRPDNIFLTYSPTGKFTIKSNSITENYISSSSLTGVLSGGNGEKIRVNYDNSKITAVNGRLTVSESSLNLALLDGSTLPTSSSGLSPGKLWNSGGFVKVV